MRRSRVLFSVHGHSPLRGHKIRLVEEGYSLMAKKAMRTIDIFSVCAGGVGLIADFISLGSLVITSNSEKAPSLLVWLIVLLSVVYSAAFLNFYTRKKMHGRYVRSYQNPLQIVSKENFRVIENGAESVTALFCYPMIIGYITMAFYIDDDYLFDGLGNIVWQNSTLLACVRGIIYGGIASAIVCLSINSTVAKIYEALEPRYKSEEPRR